MLRMNTLSKKLWLTITITMMITIIYSFIMTNLFYERLYVDKVEQSLLDEGERLALEYTGGPLNDKLKSAIEWYNTKSETEVFIVSNPRELSACLPFNVDYNSIINRSDREQLLKGKVVKKVGFEERFQRQIISVIIPLLDQERLEGIIYLYIPLESIHELTKDFSTLWLVFALLFVIVALFLGSKWVQLLTRPLKAMKRAAVKVSEGDFSTKIEINSNDEIGQLAIAFNQMSESIYLEDERKKEFIANVSHELRTPVSYIKGYSEAIISGIVDKKEEKDKYLQIIYREANRMERLVGDLLDLQSMDNEDYKMAKTPLPIAQLLEDLLEKYQTVIHNKNIHLTVLLDHELIVLGDEGRIEQILQNILDNSIRYTDNGGQIQIQLYRDDRWCRIEVKDNGIGISKEDLEHIMKRFYRANKARSRRDGGTGLGLAIVEKLVRLHNGKIKITSEVGNGTVVTIQLPSVD